LKLDVQGIEPQGGSKSFGIWTVNSGFLLDHYAQG
jgi:hypothetical protein